MERMIRKRERRKKDRSTKHCRNETEREKTMKGVRERRGEIEEEGDR